MARKLLISGEKSGLGGGVKALEGWAKLYGEESPVGDLLSSQGGDSGHTVLAANPAGDSCLADSQSLGDTVLGSEVLNEAVEDVHLQTSDRNAFIIGHRNTCLQEYRRPCDDSQMDYKHRVKAARKFAGLTQGELAERIGIKQASISDLERGKSASSSYNASIARACGVNPYWLETGQGEMLAEGSTEPTSGMDNVARLPTQRANEIEIVGDLSVWDSDTPLEDDEVYVPLYKEVELSAGNGSTAIMEVSGRMVRFARSTLREASVQPENAKAAQVSGNSMARVIMPGATIGIDIGTTQIYDGDIYAVDHGGMLRVKYVYRLPGGGLRLRSENSEEHPDEIFSGEEVLAEGIRIIGWVFWWSTVQRRRGSPY
jgi:phage repressor protein C with HTH and peptisase S24 domain